jgi:nucleoside phosphorylase
VRVVIEQAVFDEPRSDLDLVALMRVCARGRHAATLYPNEAINEPVTNAETAQTSATRWLRAGESRVFIGPIASSNILLKDGKVRDEWLDRFDVRAIEMEGSGVADAAWLGEGQYFVVRGICDYADPSKSDAWQPHAAAAAASYLRTLLGHAPMRD